MDLKSLIHSESATIVDVREPGEFAAGHIEGSLNLPLSKVMSQFDRYEALGRPLILVCRSGNRSGMVTQLLRAKGFRDVYNGGAWDDVQALLEVPA